MIVVLVLPVLRFILNVFFFCFFFNIFLFWFSVLAGLDIQEWVLNSKFH